MHFPDPKGTFKELGGKSWSAALLLAKNAVDPLVNAAKGEQGIEAGSSQKTS